jgi:isoquinoline 1-oxidoreductase
MREVMELYVNGVRHRLEVEPNRSLLSVLREDLDLTGTKYGCGEGQCGACTVLVAGRAVRSCTTPVHLAAATANHFARETAMDELAHLVGMDPLEFRLKNLKDERLRAVLEAAAHRFGWGRTKAAPDRGVGLAAGFEKGGYVATCAEIAVDRTTGEVKVLRVVTAFECGAILNPDHLTNQIEGAIVMGLGGALFEAIEFEDGKILNPRFSRYRVPRFSDLPQIDVVLLDRRDLPSAGAGETPIVGIAPAIGNAIFHATGVRLRSLPLVPNGLKGEARLHRGE